MSGIFNTVTLQRMGKVAVVSLNRPRARNAFSRELCRELTTALNQVAADESIRAVVLTGSDGCFSAGADLKEGAEKARRVEDRLNQDYRPALEVIAGMDKPVISAVSGPAAGIGMSFALVCDLMVMDESAFLYSPFATIGLIPDGGASWLLTEAIGYKRAYQMFAESNCLSSAQCLDLGLTNKVVADNQLLPATIEWAQQLSGLAPLALGLTKRVMRAQPRLSYSDAIGLEAQLQNQCATSADCNEGVSAFFEKRPPQFTGK